MVPDRWKYPTLDTLMTGSCQASWEGFVFDRILVPATKAEATKYALSFQGKKYNLLGNTLALFASQMPGVKIQLAVDEGICSGRALHLLCLSSAKSMALMWPGTAACCAAAKCTGAGGACSAAAKGNCFSGTLKAARGSSRWGGGFRGPYHNGKFSMNPSMSGIYISLSNKAAIKPLALKLKMASISGTVTGGKITDGVLTGALDRSEVNDELIPAIAEIINDVYNDPATDQKTKDMLKALFDTNKDGKITAQELRAGNTVLPVDPGDVDVDNDGKKEMSLGVGFTAVKTNISRK